MEGQPEHLFIDTPFSTECVQLDVSPEVKASPLSPSLSHSHTHTHMNTHPPTHTHTHTRAVSASFGTERYCLCTLATAGKVIASIFPGSFRNLKRFLIATGD